MITFSTDEEVGKNKIDGWAIGPDGNELKWCGWRDSLDGYRTTNLLLSSFLDGLQVKVSDADISLVIERMTFKSCRVTSWTASESVILTDLLHFES